MTWNIEYLPEVNKDFKELDSSQRAKVFKAIKKVCNNPLSQSEGGYGKPLGNKNGKNLTGCYKIKLKASGLRVVYKLIRTDDKMLVIVVGARADEEVYELADKRIIKHKL